MLLFCPTVGQIRDVINHLKTPAILHLLYRHPRCTHKTQFFATESTQKRLPHSAISTTSKPLPLLLTKPAAPNVSGSSTIAPSHAVHESSSRSPAGLPPKMDHLNTSNLPTRGASSAQTGVAEPGMEKDKNRELTLVAGRKAARLLMLFRGDAHNALDALIEDRHLCPELETQNEPRAPSKSPCRAKPAADADNALSVGSSPSLEPVSSATYIPHHPVKLQEGPADEKVSDHPDKSLQHLTADVEFDRCSNGDITRIKKRTPERRRSRKTTKVSFTDLPETATAHEQNTESLASVSFDVSGLKDAQLSSLEDDSNENDQTTPLGESPEAYPLTVELRPFKNKVGGHTAIFRFSKRAVCKALMNRENVWYEAVEKLHPELLAFLPKYIGVLNVRYSSLVSEGNASPSLGSTDEHHAELIHGSDLSGKVFEERKALSNDFKQSRRSRLSEDGPPPEVSLDDNLHIIPDLLRKHYSSSAPSVLEDLSQSVEGHPEAFSPTVSEKSAHDASIGSTSVNQDLQAQIIQEVFVPHGSKSDDIFEMDHDYLHSNDHRTSSDHELHLSNGEHEEKENHKNVLRKHTRFERFILLEDLTAEMQRPCALDLKMGTRQYGLEATAAKQASQRKKCATTTSRQLGVRVCGLQVWDRGKQKYAMRDKYFGRKLRSGVPFAKTLAKFLYDGLSAFSIICKIPQIIDQLEELIEIFSKLVGYRMYGLSVLLMYDGAGSEKAQVKANIIDFAQSVLGDENFIQSYSRPPQHPDKPDMGYLRGLTSITRYLKAIFKIVSGDEYDEVAKNVDDYLEANHDRLKDPFKWVEDFVETDESVQPNDAFNIHYDDYAYDDDDVSE